MIEKVKNIISQMTLEEKASLCSGKNFWQLKGVERLGIPSIMVTDGPHGLRKQAGDADHLGLNQSVKATCFPPAVTSASSWDSAALYEMGKAMAMLQDMPLRSLAMFGTLSLEIVERIVHESGRS